MVARGEEKGEREGRKEGGEEGEEDEGRGLARQGGGRMQGSCKAGGHRGHSDRGAEGTIIRLCSSNTVHCGFGL